MTLDKSGLKYINTNYIPHSDVLLFLSLLFLKPLQYTEHHYDVLTNECQDQSTSIQHSKENTARERQYANITYKPSRRCCITLNFFVKHFSFSKWFSVCELAKVTSSKSMK